MQIKYLLHGIVAITLALTLTACPEEVEVSKEAGITFFGIPNQNGFIEFQNRYFTISAEPIDGYYEITNDKPFPYGALNDSLYFTFFALSGNTVITTIQTDSAGVPKDSIVQIASQSIKLPFKPDPVILRTFAPDLNYSKQYKIIVSEDTYNPDQVNWAGPDVLAEIPFNPEGFYQAYSLGNTVFVMYGMPIEVDGVIENKLYSSTDGKSWSEHTLSDGNYPSGIYHAFSRLKDKIVCFSSLQMDETGHYIASDAIWTSTNGIDWQKETSSLSLGMHAFHSIKNLNGTLYAFGGTEVVPGQTSLEKALYDTTYTEMDVTYKFPPEASLSIYKYDGTNWSTSSELTALEMPSRFTASSYAKGRIYSVNGESSANGLISSNTWATETGEYWLRTANQSSNALEGATLVNFNPYLWRIGGKDETGTVMGIMETVDDGASWFAVSKDNRPNVDIPENIKPTYDHASIIDAIGRLWIIGGKNIDGGVTDVWVATKN